MKQLLETHWLLHGEGELSWVLLAPLVVVGLALCLWCLRGHRRQGWAGRLLPFTATLLLLLVGYLAWQPTLVRIDLWEHPTQVLVAVDPSDSMRVPLTGADLSANLDLLTFWDPAAAPQRNTAGRDLARDLLKAQQQAVALRRGLDEILAQLEEGVPLGSSAQQTVSAYGQWLAAIRQSLARQMDSLRARADGGNLAANDAIAAPTLEAALKQLVEQSDRMPTPTQPLTADNVSSLAQAGAQLDSLTQAALEPLHQWQSSVDQAFLAAHRDALAPRLEELARQTRLDAAERLLQSLPASRAAAGPAAVLEQTHQTDLYAHLARLLAQHRDDVVSQVVLISDGGHNGGADPGVTQKLKKSGIALTAIGVGRPQQAADWAILDWQAPALAQAGEPMAVRVTLKAPASQLAKAQLVISAGTEQLHETALVSDGQTSVTIYLSFPAPKEGRHILDLAITTADANPANNRVRFGVETLGRTPRALLLGDDPDWDSAYFYLAMQRLGLDVRQLFPGVDDSPPKRGGTSKAIPQTLAQWDRQQVVLLQGKPFSGFSGEDAGVLRQYVGERGGSLIVLVRPGESWLAPLSSAFAWNAAAQPGADAHLRLPTAAEHLPVMRLGIDGPSSARRYANLVACVQSAVVPAQDLTLLTNAAGEPLVSLGFYGRGRVYLWGISGLRQISAYEKAQTVDRLLEQLLGEAALPLAPAEDASVACYPRLPAPGNDNLMIARAAELTQATIAGQDQPVTFTRGAGAPLARWRPAAPGPVQVTAGNWQGSFEAVANPGLEQVYFEFNEDFLQQMAQRAQGSYLPMAQAPAALAAMKPDHWRAATAQRYPLANHWLLLLLIAAVAAAHWTLRKLAGLAI